VANPGKVTTYTKPQEKPQEGGQVLEAGQALNQCDAVNST
jgi:hypothetical protein